MASHEQIPVLMLFYESRSEGLDVFEQLKKESPSIASYLSVNAKNNPEVAKTFKVIAVPTFLLLKNGKECWRHTGMTTLDVLKSNLSLLEPINKEAFI